MKTSDILNSQPVVSKILSFDLALPIGFKISKVVKELEVVLKLYEEKRKNLFESYGEDVIKKGKEPTKQIKKEHLEVFQKEMDSILNSDIDLKFNKIKASELTEVKITTQELMQVEWLIEE